MKCAFIGEKNFERYQNARHDNKKNPETLFLHVIRLMTM